MQEVGRSLWGSMTFSVTFVELVLSKYLTERVGMNNYFRKGIVANASTVGISVELTDRGVAVPLAPRPGST